MVSVLVAVLVPSELRLDRTLPDKVDELETLGIAACVKVVVVVVVRGLGLGLGLGLGSALAVSTRRGVCRPRPRVSSEGDSD